MTIIAGMNFASHQSSLAVVKDGRIIYGMQEERLNRRKYSPEFPAKCIKRFFELNPELKFEDIDAWVSGWNVPYNAESHAKMQQHWRYRPEVVYQMPTHLHKVFENEGLKNCIYGTSDWFYKDKVTKCVHVNHHWSHAYSSIMTSGFSDCAFITCDNMGDEDCMTWGTWNETLNPIERYAHPLSPGIVYSTIVAFLGFGRFEDWKMMAVASVPISNSMRVEYLNKFEKIMRWDKKEEEIYIDLRYMEYGLDRRSRFTKLRKLFDLDPIKPGEELSEKHIAVAYAAQITFENVMLALCHKIKKVTGQKNICLSGGSFMNCVFNGLLSKLNVFADVWVGGWAADEGTSIGAAYYYANEILKLDWRVKREDRISFDPGFSDESIHEDLEKWKIGYWRGQKGLINDHVCNRLLEGKIIGWYQAGCEFGQRALGHRSILADPSKEGMKDKINASVKYREWYRPFAPVCLAEDAPDLFEDYNPSTDYRYMDKVLTVRKKWRDKIPAVVHLDNTARLQIEPANTRLGQLLTRWRGKSGIPCLLNTSFNVAGEPIVNSPQDAIKTFFTSGIEELILNSYVVSK